MFGDAKPRVMIHGERRIATPEILKYENGKLKSCVADGRELSKNEFGLTWSTGMKDLNGNIIFGCDMVEIETHDFWSCPMKVWYDQKNAAWKAGDCELCLIGEEHIMVVGNVCEMEDDDELAEKEETDYLYEVAAHEEELDNLEAETL